MSSRLLFALFATVIHVALGTPAIAADARPAVSEKPYAMMQKLSVMQGDWLATTQISEDDGKTWRDLGTKAVHVQLKHKGMLLSETPARTSTSGFDMDIDIAYDQYRNVYRMAATDDVWGIMDIYEGQLEGRELVMTNLKSGTFFPIAEDTWRGFRLRLTLGTPHREMIIDKTDDDGASWQPAFRIDYRLSPMN